MQDYVWCKKGTGVPRDTNFQIHQGVFYLASQLEILHDLKYLN